MKGKKLGGRTKGTPNKKTEHFFDICTKRNHDPVEFNVMIAQNDWEALGYSKPTVTVYTKTGDSYEQDVISVSDRMSANNKLLDFMYPKRKSVEITNSEDSSNVFLMAYNPKTMKKNEPKPS